MGIFAPDGKLAGFLNTLGELIALNILTVFCALPVFTIGPALTALFACTLRILRGENGSHFHYFLTALRSNFRQSAILGLGAGGCIAFLAFDIWLLTTLQGSFGQVYRVVLFVVILLIILVSLYCFALISRFQNTLKNHIKNAVILSLGKPGPALLILVVFVLPIVLLAISYRFISVLFLAGISGPVYLSSKYFAHLFQRFENKPQI